MLKKISNAIAHLRDRQVVKNATSAEFEVDNWMLSRFVMRRLVPIVGIRPFPLSELMLMSGAVCRFRPTHIFEWGTHVGKSARVFYETATYFGISTKIHSIDLPDDVSHGEHPKNKRGRLVRGKKNVCLHQGDGLNTSLGIISGIKGEYIPLFYVDGDHGYDSVKRELEGIILHVPNAAILLHDTFYQSEDAGYNVGPFQAIEDVLGAHPEHGYSRIDTKTGLPGMTLLYKKKTS